MLNYPTTVFQATRLYVAGYIEVMPDDENYAILRQSFI